MGQLNMLVKECTHRTNNYTDNNTISTTSTSAISATYIADYKTLAPPSRYQPTLLVQSITIPPLCISSSRLVRLSLNMRRLHLSNCHSYHNHHNHHTTTTTIISKRTSIYLNFFIHASTYYLIYIYTYTYILHYY